MGRESISAARDVGSATGCSSKVRTYAITGVRVIGTGRLCGAAQTAIFGGNRVTSCAHSASGPRPGVIRATDGERTCLSPAPITPVTSVDGAGLPPPGLVEGVRLVRTVGTSVVVVGAGPAGLTLGVLLRRRGIDCVVVDKFTREQLPARSRAGFLERRTVQLLDRHGLSTRLRAEGLAHTRCEIHAEGERGTVDYEAWCGDARGRTSTSSDARNWRHGIPLLPPGPQRLPDVAS
ncbi:FAD-dependent monooxygenase [Streptomyces sp. NPDC002754]